MPYTCQLYYIPANWDDLQSDWTPIKSSFFTLTHGQKFLRMRLGIQSDLNSIKSSFKPTWWETSTAGALEFNDLSLQWFSLPHCLSSLYCIVFTCIVLYWTVFATCCCVQESYQYCILCTVFCVCQGIIFGQRTDSAFSPFLTPQHFLKMIKCANDGKGSRGNGQIDRKC